MTPPDNYDAAAAATAFSFYYDRALPGEVAIFELVATLRARAQNMIAARRKMMVAPSVETERLIDTVEAAFTTAANALRKTPTFRELTEERRAKMESAFLTIQFPET